MSEKRKCKTCIEIAEIAEINKELAMGQKGFTKVLKVKLTTKTYDKKNRLRGSIEYRARDINYCPECGKRLDKEKILWKL